MRATATRTFGSFRGVAQHGKNETLSADAPLLFRRPFSTKDISTTLGHEESRPYNEIPGDWKSTIPLLGTMPIFLPYLHKESGGIRGEDFMRDYYFKFGKEYNIARMGERSQQVVIVYDSGYLQVFHNEGKYPSGILTGAWAIRAYNEAYVPGNPINPFLADGETWRKGRMAVNPYLFNIHEARSYSPTINKSVRSAVQYFEDYSTSGKLNRFCELASFDMFTAASIGLQLDSFASDGTGKSFADTIVGSIGAAGKVAQECPYSKFKMLRFSGWERFRKSWSEGRQAGEELLRIAVSQAKDTNTPAKGIMHGFMNDENRKISLDEATEMYLVLTFAAADTTSSLINAVLTQLAKHPDVQDRVRTEMMEVLKGNDYVPEGTKLPYFEQVVKETHRLTPALPFTNVKSNIPKDLVINGFNVAKGSTVIFSNMGIANDETLAGPDPQLFNPDRFSQEQVAARKGTRAEFLDHPVACKPFGFGARMCVGSRIAKLEYTSLIARVVQDFAFSIDRTNSMPEEEMVRVANPTSFPRPGYWFNVTKL